MDYIKMIEKQPIMCYFVLVVLVDNNYAHKIMELFLYILSLNMKNCLLLREIHVNF